MNLQLIDDTTLEDAIQQCRDTFGEQPLVEFLDEQPFAVGGALTQIQFLCEEDDGPERVYLMVLHVAPFNQVTQLQPHLETLPVQTIGIRIDSQALHYLASSFGQAAMREMFVEMQRRAKDED